jgi:hypothetical protein
MMNMQHGQAFAAQCGERMQEHNGVDATRQAHDKLLPSLHMTLQVGGQYRGQPRSQPWCRHVNAR